MKQDTLIAVVFIVIIVVAGGSLAYIGSKAFEGIMDWVNQGTQAGTTEGMGIGFTIQYKDGSKETYDPDMTSLSLLPLQIRLPDDTKAIDEVHITVKAVIDYTGEAYGYITFSGSLTVLMGGELRQTADLADQQNPQASGSTYKVAGAPVVFLDDSTIERWAGTYGTYTIECNADLTISMGFTDGKVETKAGSGSGSLQIIYESDPAKITGLSVSVATYPVYLPDRPR